MRIATLGSPSREGHAPFGLYQTWYRVIGEPAPGAPPLILLHGGPGCTSDYLDDLGVLAHGGRAVVLYDQIGNGRSTHLRDKPKGFWTVDLFKAELANLIDHLGFGGAHSLLGQSWGGMLAAEYAIDRPVGLKALVLSNSPASMPIWSAESIRLRRELPADVLALIEAHEASGTIEDAAYKAAMEQFALRHVCRVPPSDGLQRMRVWMDDDPTVTLAMNGPNDFPVSGNLKDWSVIGRLWAIAVPTLVISGRYDQATPAAIGPMATEIPGARWEIFEQSSHIPHVEEPGRFIATVEEFLSAHGA